MKTASLLNRTLIVESLTNEAAWEWSHGASGNYLGCGLLYYCIVHMLKAQTAVCLGSGGGFVPRLMRQAQRDLGIDGTARTILIDANIPAAGWGSPDWLAVDSFFRTQFPDIEIILDRTTHAAQHHFADPGVRIDYLHIDADHSFEGCLADFRSYYPLLREGSIVTLHDTNFQGAGVKQVLEYVRTLADCELVDLNDIGSGTALVRIGRRSSRTLPTSEFTRHEEARPTVNAQRKSDALPVAAPSREWKYLESSAFATRYALAAHFVADCRNIIEIGGAKTPIDHFLRTPHDSVLVVDPFIREHHVDKLHDAPCRVDHLRACFQDIDWRISDGADYGLVMLGLEIQGLESKHYESLFQLVNHARITVIEFPTSWSRSREQFDRILQNTRTREVFQAKLDLTGNDFGDLSNSWPPRCDREIHVLAPR